MKKPRLDKVMSSVYSTILERFGEPIGDAAAVPGVPDEREDEGSEMIGTRTVRPVAETRFRVSQHEIVTTWEDLYAEQGAVSLDELASWLGTTARAVEPLLPDWLQVNEEGDVVEAEANKYAMAEAKNKGPSKKAAKSWVKGTKKFSDKVAKAKRAGMENPEGFAASMEKAATGKWPSQK